ncbi:MAG: hypothetical protein J3K34DRAFT_468238 [Monoraphidium minutum]|nr:MAG: hypothetical protein J3K34DRAFT_468238 [Monoraphidium minutum]
MLQQHMRPGLRPGAAAPRALPLPLPRLARAATRAPLRVAAAAQPQPPSPEELARQAQDFARRTTRQVSQFVRERELDKKAAAAVEDANQRLRTSYMKLDAEYDLTGRWSNLQGQVKEKAQDIDQQFSLRRKLRALTEDAKRLAPIWKRRTSEFAATTQGKAAFTFLFVGLLLSGTLFKILNLVWLGWWVSLPVSIFLADQQRRKQRGEAAAAAGAAPRSAWGGRGRGGGGGGGAGGWDRTGPVVEAEWVSLDDDGSPKRK